MDSAVIWTTTQEKIHKYRYEKMNISFVYFSKQKPFSFFFLIHKFSIPCSSMCCHFGCHSVEVCSFECGGDWRSVCSKEVLYFHLSFSGIIHLKIIIIFLFQLRYCQ